MKDKNKEFFVIALFIAVFVMLPLYAEAYETVKTGAEDIKQLSLCIYNNNLGLIREIREAVLPMGISELMSQGISEKIMPGSIRVKGMNIEFLEQTYEYDLITQKTLLDRYVGKEIKLIEKDKETGKEREINAELLSNNQGPVYRIGGEIHIGHPGRVVLPDIPEGLLSEPSLAWKISSTQAGKHSVEISYLTEGLDWESDYSILLNPEDTRGDLSCWVTIRNNTGVDYKQANINLMAGDVKTVEKPRLMRFKAIETADAMSSGVSEERVFEYHLYNLPGRISLMNKQAKQINFLTAERIPVKKEMRYYGGEQYYRHRYMDTPGPQRVGVYLELQNRKTYHLGVPLPEGIVRVYKKDSGGAIQFLGEDRVSHTPEDEKIRIQMGYAFDIVAERKQTDWRKPSSDLIETVWEIVLRNQKDEAAWVVVLESVPGDWEVMESSHQWEKEDAHSLRFDISVAPKGEEKIRYTVRMKI